MRRVWRVILIIFTVLVYDCCKEPFNPKMNPVYTNALVVEGIINANGPSTIKLSRSVPLKDTLIINSETKAQVLIEGDDNSVYQVGEKVKGTYVSDSFNLNKNIKYRLHIKTSAGGEYLSGFVPVKKTPAIDSISYRLINGGVQIYVNSHDASNNTRYYKWDYDETWEIHSAFPASYIYSNGVVTPRDASELPKLYYCWQSGISTSILTGASIRLTNDVISEQSIIFIPRASIKTSVRYSLLLRQYALDRQSFDFYEQMKKNTESLGSIFDPLPSELTGNIVCVSNSNEKVIGFVTVLTVEQKRIFISKDDIGGSFYSQGCESVLVANNKDSFALYYDDIGLMPYAAHATGPGIDHYYSSASSCIDCRLRGTNVKPSFW